MIYGSFHYVGLGFCIFFLGAIFVPSSARVLENDLNNYLSRLNKAENSANAHTQVEVVLSKVILFKNQFRNQVVPNVIFALSFGLWPFLQVEGSSYFLAVVWSSAQIIIFFSLYLNLPVESPKQVNVSTIIRSSSNQINNASS